MRTDQTISRSLFQFREKILNEQAAWERERPVKACLERMFGARQLVCCASAMADFRTILGTLGGPGERERGEKLIKRIQVVPDQTSLKTERLATSGKTRFQGCIKYCILSVLCLLLIMVDN